MPRRRGGCAWPDAARPRCSARGATHLDVLAMRGVWCSERHVSAFARDAADVSDGAWFRRVLSPLLPVDLLGGYRHVGMHDLAPIVAIQGTPDHMPVADVPPGVDAATRRPPQTPWRVARLDAECFEEFWRYGADELAELLSRERCIARRGRSMARSSAILWPP